MSEFNNTNFEGQQQEGFEYGSFNDTNGYFNNQTYSGNGTYNNTNNGTFSADDETVKIVPTSFYTPFLYGAILLICLFFFSKYYKQQRIKQLTQLRSIFDEHDARDLYFEIKEMKEAGEVKVHDKVIKAALLNRGAENIRRSFKLKELMPQVENLYKNGSIGDDYWKSFQTETKVTEAEVKDCIVEAEKIQPGWPQAFLQLCQEICFNQALQRRYNSILERKNTCIKEWDLDIDADGHMISKTEEKK